MPCLSVKAVVGGSGKRNGCSAIIRGIDMSNKKPKFNCPMCDGIVRPYQGWGGYHHRTINSFDYRQSLWVQCVVCGHKFLAERGD